jgi:hypothetical protein
MAVRSEVEIEKLLEEVGDVVAAFDLLVKSWDELDERTASLYNFYAVTQDVLN